MAAKDRSEKGAVPGEGRKCNQTHWKEEEKVQSSTPCGGRRQWCLGRSEHIAPSVRLAKRREGLGVPSLADLTNLLLTGCGAFMLDGTKRFHDKSMSDRAEGRTKIGLPELRRNNGKWEHVQVWQLCQRR